MAKKVQPKKAQGKKAAVKKAAPAKKTVPAKKAAPVKKIAPAKKTVPVKKAAPVKKMSPAKKTVPVKKAAPVKKMSPAKKTVPVKKAAPVKKMSPAKKTVPVKKAAPVKKIAPAKKTAPVKKAAPVKKTIPVKKAVAEKKTIPAKSVSKIIPVKVVKPATAAKGISLSEKGTKKMGGILNVKIESQKPVAHGKEIRAILLKNREDILKEITEYRIRESDPLKRDVGDIYDDASSERDRELSLLLGDRDRQKLIEIDEALRRIDSGEYGVCESCGEKITPGRIKAQPFTKLCINCKAEEERQEARQKKFEAEGVFRSINYSEEEEG